jgi:outer membrane protein TolC
VNARAFAFALTLGSTLVSAPAAAGPSGAPPLPSPLTLEAAVRHAAERYPAILASNARVDAQESAVDLARTAYLPRLDSGVQVNQATRNNVSGLLLPGLPYPAIAGPVIDETSATAWGSAAAVLLSWEAFDFGLRGASMDYARAQLTRATAGAELTRLDVAVRAGAAFLSLAAAEETVRAARANVDRQQVFADSVRALVTNELRPGADDSRAQAELAHARIQAIQAEQARSVARASLAQWLGVPPGAIAIDGQPLLTAPPPPESAFSAEEHPLAETQMAAVESTRALRKALGRSYAPRFDLQAVYSWRGTGFDAVGADLGGDEGLDFATENWAAGVTVSFPVFGWFPLRERRRVEAANERAEIATYDRVLAELDAQSEQARAEVEGARLVAENTPIELDAARVLERQSRARYDAGLADIVEVADAQRLLLQAEVGDAVARLALWRARLVEAAARGDVDELFE